MRKGYLFIVIALVSVAGIAAAATTLKTVTTEIYYMNGTTFISTGNQFLPCAPGGTGCTIAVSGIQKQAYIFDDDSQTYIPLKDD